MDGLVLAQPERAISPEFTNLAIGLCLLGLAVLVGVLVMVWVRKLFQSEKEEVSPNDLLSDFRRMRDQGLMSEAEFTRVRGLLGNKLREEVGHSPIDIALLPPIDTNEIPSEAERESSESEYDWEDIDIESLEKDKSRSPHSES
jgi:hypothetical protein